MVSPTRQELLDAAVGLLLDEDGAGITTVRLAQRAGVVQSAFYNHFSSVAECRAMALQEVERRVGEVAAAVFSVLQRPDAMPDADVEPILLDLFQRTNTAPTVYRLMVHRHHEPDVGAMIDNVLALVRDAVYETLRLGTSHNGDEDDARCRVAAHVLVNVFLSGLEQVLDGAEPTVVAATCAAFMTSGIATLSR